MNEAAIHAKFALMQDRGDIADWPFDPAIIEPPEAAPLFATALALVSGDCEGDDLSDDELISAARHGMFLASEEIISIAELEAAVRRVLAALSRELRGIGPCRHVAEPV